MNLKQLFEINDILFVNHFRILEERCITLFLFDKTIKDYSIFISTDNIDKLNEFCEDNFNDYLLKKDSIENYKDSIIIFSTLSKYNEYRINTTSGVDKNFKKYNIKLIILNNKFNTDFNLKAEVINVVFNYFDNLIPIIIFDSDDKKEYAKRIISLNLDKNDHIIMGESSIREEHNIHFINIPTLDQLNEVRSHLNSSSNLFFYIKYSEEGNIEEDGIKYNKLLDDFNKQRKVTYNKKLKVNSNGIYFS